MKELPLLNVLWFFIGCCFFTACVNDSVNPLQTNPDYGLNYIVHCKSLTKDTLHITIEISPNDLDDTLTFIAPPLYADNPFLNQTSRNFHNLSVLDSSLSSIAFTTDSVSFGEYKSLTFTFLTSDKPKLVEYDVSFFYRTDSTMSFMPIPGTNKNIVYYQGNYLFAIPYSHSTLSGNWREPVEISVTISHPKDIQIIGAPTQDARYSTPYELLFATIIAMSANVVPQQLLFENIAAGQAFRCMNYSFEKTFSQPVVNKTQNDFIILLKDIIPKFGILDESPVTIITGLNDKIGLEGTNAFWVRNPFENDDQGVIAMTLAHELLHSWIGIRTGDHDASWWKEGMTNYLGYLVAKRNGLCTQSYFEKGILKDLSNNKAVQTLSLSKDSEFIRNNIFRDSEIGDLVYRKGAQISMLFDRKIWVSSQGTKDLVDCMASFIKIFDSRSFYFHEFLQHIKTYSLADVSDIVSLYIDSTGAIPDSILKENLNALISLGALGG